MGGEVFRALVRLGFDDPPHLSVARRHADQMHAYEFAGNDQSVAGVEGAGELVAV
jgi:hypothetical protein